MFVSYLRSVYLQKDKSIFKLNELPVERFSDSPRLSGMPKIRFLTREMAKKIKDASRAVVASDPSSAHRQGEGDETQYDASETSGDETSDEEEETSRAIAVGSAIDPKVRTSNVEL